jgi:hypothetical protein
MFDQLLRDNIAYCVSNSDEREIEAAALYLDNGRVIERGIRAGLLQANGYASLERLERLNGASQKISNSLVRRPVDKSAQVRPATGNGRRYSPISQQFGEHIC